MGPLAAIPLRSVDVCFQG